MNELGFSVDWDKTTDSVEWIDDNTGYKCAIRRIPMMGHLCGYVGIDESNPAFGAYIYSSGSEENSGLSVSEKLNDVSVHGGLTYESFTNPVTDRQDGLYWFGFDCAHYLDLVPGLNLPTGLIKYEAVYRDVSFVKEECLKLANELCKISNNCTNSNLPK